MVPLAVKSWMAAIVASPPALAKIPLSIDIAAHPGWEQKQLAFGSIEHEG